jgi:hypothetical protein
MQDRLNPLGLDGRLRVCGSEGLRKLKMGLVAHAHYFVHRLALHHHMVIIWLRRGQVIVWI